MTSNQSLGERDLQSNGSVAGHRARGSSDDDLYKATSRINSAQSLPKKALSDASSQSFDHDSGSETVSTPCDINAGPAKIVTGHPLRLTIGFCGSRRCSLCILSPNRLAMLFHVAVLLAAFVGALVGIHFKEVFLPSIQKMTSSISQNWADISEAAGRRFALKEDGLFDEYQTLWGKVTSVLSIWPVVALMIFVLLTRVKLESDPSQPKGESEVLTDVLCPTTSTADSDANGQCNLVRCRNLNGHGNAVASFSTTVPASTSTPSPSPSPQAIAPVHPATPMYCYPSAEFVGERIANRFSVAAINAVEGSDVGSTDSNPSLDQDAYEMAFNSMFIQTTAANSLNHRHVDSYQSMYSPSTLSGVPSASAVSAGVGASYTPSLDSNNISRSFTVFPNPYQSVPLTIPPSFLSLHQNTTSR